MKLHREEVAALTSEIWLLLVESVCSYQYQLHSPGAAYTLGPNDAWYGC